MSKFRIHVRRPSPAMVVALLALVVAASGVAVAAIPNSSTGEIHGCYSQRNGALRVIDTEASPPETCNATKELGVSWSKQGPKGDQGIQGIQGVKGDQGLPGDQGPAGISFVGSPCASGDGTYDGTVQMGVNGTNGDIILTCVNPPGGGGWDPEADVSAHDTDNDGYTYIDCNDSDSTIHPGAFEVVGDEIDNGCDGTMDEDESDPTVPCDDGNPYTTKQRAVDACIFNGSIDADFDGDGYVAYESYSSGTFSGSGNDCDDGEATTHLGADETADGVDNDCDGLVDETP